MDARVQACCTAAGAPFPKGTWQACCRSTPRGGESASLIQTNMPSAPSSPTWKLMFLFFLLMSSMPTPRPRRAEATSILSSNSLSSFSRLRRCVFAGWVLPSCHSLGSRPESEPFCPPAIPASPCREEGPITHPATPLPARHPRLTLHVGRRPPPLRPRPFPAPAAPSPGRHSGRPRPWRAYAPRPPPRRRRCRYTCVCVWVEKVKRRRRVWTMQSMSRNRPAAVRAAGSIRHDDPAAAAWTSATMHPRPGPASGTPQPAAHVSASLMRRATSATSVRPSWGRRSALQARCQASNSASLTAELETRARGMPRSLKPRATRSQVLVFSWFGPKG